MSNGKAIFDLYNALKKVGQPHHAKHSVSDIILCILEDIEASGRPVTPEAIEEALAKEVISFSPMNDTKKVS